MLTNCLLETLTHNPNPPSAEIETKLKKYQDLRKRRAKTFVKLSGLISRDQTLATLRETLKFLYLPLPSSEVMADLQTTLLIKAPYLKFLPLPKRLDGNGFWKEGLEEEREAEMERAK